MKYFKIALKTVHALLYLCYTLLIPKDKTLWVFGAWGGRSYSDNSKELFEYVCREHPEINAVWIAKNENVYTEVKTTGNKVVLYPSKEAKKLIAHAGVNVQTESNEDTGRFRVGGTKIIQLWHGIGDAKTTFNRMGIIKKIIVEMYSDVHHQSYWMTSSNHQKSIIQEYFHTPSKKIFVTGTPRTDGILTKRFHPFFESYRSNKVGYKFIAYMPTHRNFGNNKYNILEQSELSKVNEFLYENNYYLFIKPHPLEAYKYKDIESRYSNIEVLTGMDFSNTQEYLHYFDVLISDYSSVIYDYLCLNRPIILFTYDIEEFVRTDMGIRDDYLSLLPGPQSFSWMDVCNNINNSLKNDIFAEKRSGLISRYYKYLDTDNSKRVFNEIVMLLNN